MQKINLETELIRQNRVINTPQELLKMEVFEKADMSLVSNLETVFPNIPTVEGKRLAYLRKSKSDEVAVFDNERVVHISQIEELCYKYKLKFLSTFYYSGLVPPEAVKKITEFELKYNKKMKVGKFFNGTHNDNETTSYICAPKSSFKLETQKDPLLFYKINDEYYYLIHKWGNDLSSSRRILGFLGSESLFAGMFILAFAITNWILLDMEYHTTPQEKMGWGLAITLSVIVGFIAGTIVAMIMSVFSHEPRKPFK